MNLVLSINYFWAFVDKSYKSAYAVDRGSETVTMRILSSRPMRGAGLVSPLSDFLASDFVPPQRHLQAIEFLIPSHCSRKLFCWFAKAFIGVTKFC